MLSSTSKHNTILWVLLSSVWLHTAIAQSIDEFTIDTEDGLIFLLLIIFFSVNFGTPIIRWLYLNYLERFAVQAAREIGKAQKRLSERMSDAGRKVSQTIRA